MNNDILESEEFENLMVALAYCPLEKEPLHKSNIKAFIRQHYTPKTVEENCCVFRDALDNMMGVKEHKFIYDDDVILFTGTREECETEMKRLESLTKGREESKIICMGEAFGRARCPVDCQNCIDMDEEHESASLRAQPTTNRDNYRAEFLSVATAAMNGMLANSISKEEGVEPFWYMQSDRVAQYALEYAKSLLKAIDKEVKSNPASE